MVRGSGHRRKGQTVTGLPFFSFTSWFRIYRWLPFWIASGIGADNHWNALALNLASWRDPESMFSVNRRTLSIN